jgi:hypothetical protein
MSPLKKARVSLEPRASKLKTIQAGFSAFFDMQLEEEEATQVSGLYDEKSEFSEFSEESEESDEEEEEKKIYTKGPAMSTTTSTKGLAMSTKTSIHKEPLPEGAVASTKCVLKVYF